MKHFFYIVFGGLALVLVILFSINVIKAVKSAKPVPIEQMTSPKMFSAISEEDSVNTTSELWPAATTSVGISKNTISSIGAKAYAVMDTSDSSLVLSNNSDILLPVASLTKLVTAVIAYKVFSSDAEMTITKKVLATYGNTADFQEGETFTVHDLLYPLLLVSSNDAAEALAQTYGRQAFIKTMNDFTQSIGAYRTYFADPAGLSPQSVSTAHDVAIILDWIYKNQPGLLDITLEKSKTIRSHTWVNPTHFLSWS